MPLFDGTERASSRRLLLYVAVADTLVWLAGVPFELYCRTLLTSRHVGHALLALMLLANASLLATMAFAMAASAVLASRGFRLRAKLRPQEREP